MLDQLSSATPATLWLIDYPSFRVAFLSDAFELIFNQRRTHTMATPFHWEVGLHPLDRDRVPAAFRAMADTGTFDETYRIVRPDGEVRWIHNFGRALRDAGGSVFRLAGVAEDVTTQHHAQEQLREAREAAEAASRAKSEFLANMSHEIRTPMTAILGYADLLAEEVTEALSLEQRVKHLSTIRRNGEHLLNVINDILDLSKIEAGRMSVEVIPTDICHIIADISSLTRVRATDRGIAFEVDYDSPLPRFINTDPTRVRQILINLLANAVKFTERGVVRLIVRYVFEEAGWLEFEVLDTGIGMTPEQVSALYRPFTQGDTSTARRYGGTGLGLTICQRLAQMLGGEIRLVETVPDRGSHFMIRLNAPVTSNSEIVEEPRTSASVTGGAVAAFGADHAVGLGHPLPGESVRFERPLAALVAAPPPQTTEAGPRPPEREKPLRGMRILYAEDGPDNQRLISLLLERVGATVTLVENGALALEAALAADAAGAPYDVVVMDMQMPVMDGYEATGLLRARGYRRPVIALTAHAMSGDRERCLRAGCDDYATKPVDRRKLIETIVRTAAPARKS